MYYDFNTRQWMDQPGVEPQSSLFRRVVADPLVGVAKGVLHGIPNALVGIANLPTFGAAGALQEAVGDPIGKVGAGIESLYSPEHAAAAARVGEAKGFIGTAKAALKEPGYLVDFAAEQLPTMFAGGAAAKAALAARGVKASGAAAGALGEGAVTAGQQAEDIRRQSESGFLTPGQVLTAAGSGALTGAIGYGMGSAAARLGVNDIDTLVAGGARNLGRGVGGVVARAGAGAATEALEETAQSYTEQMAQNLALGRPITEGAAEAAGLGAVVGGVMGGAMGAYTGEGAREKAKGAYATLTAPPEAGAAPGVTPAHDAALRDFADYLRWDGYDTPAITEWRLQAMETLNSRGALSEQDFAGMSVPLDEVMPAPQAAQPKYTGGVLVVPPDGLPAPASATPQADAGGVEAGAVGAQAEVAPASAQQPMKESSDGLQEGRRQEEVAPQVDPAAPAPKAEDIVRMARGLSVAGKKIDGRTANALAHWVNKSQPKTQADVIGFLQAKAKEADSDGVPSAQAAAAQEFLRTMGHAVPAPAVPAAGVAQTIEGVTNVQDAQTQGSPQGAGPGPAAGAADAAVQPGATKSTTKRNAPAKPAIREVQPKEEVAESWHKMRLGMPQDAAEVVVPTFNELPKEVQAEYRAAPPERRQAVFDGYTMKRNLEAKRQGERDKQLGKAWGEFAAQFPRAKLPAWDSPYVPDHLKTLFASSAKDAAFAQFAQGTVAAARKAEADAKATAYEAGLARIKGTVQQLLDEPTSAPRHAERVSAALSEYNKHVKAGEGAKQSNAATSLADLQEKLGLVRESKGATAAYGESLAEVVANIDAVPKGDRVASLLRTIVATGPEWAAAVAEFFLQFDTSKVTVDFNPESPLNKAGRERQGTFIPSENRIVIFGKGATPHVVLHEIAHALSARALSDALERAKQGGEAAAAARKVLDPLYTLAEYLRTNKKFADESLRTTLNKDLYEMVAEIITNPAVQQRLAAEKAPDWAKAPKPGSLWAWFVHSLSRLFSVGLRTKHAVKDSMLDYALSVTGGLFADNVGAFKHSSMEAQADLDLTANVLRGAASWADKARSSEWYAKLRSSARKAYMHLSSTGHIEHIINGMPALRSLGPAFKQYFGADRATTQARTMINDAAHKYLRRLEITLARYGKDSDKMDRLLGEIGGEASRLGFDYRQNYAVNQARIGASLGDSVEIKRAVADIHQKYLALKNGSKNDKELAALLDEGVLANRKNYTMQTATALRALIHASTSNKSLLPAFDYLRTKFADRLDILMEKGTQGKAPPEHLDATAAALHDTIYEVFNAVLGPKSLFASQALYDEVSLVRSFYEKAWQNPYLHLGRHGDYFVRFAVKTPDEATAAKLNTLFAPFGKQFGAFKKGSASVYMRFENEAQMLQAKAIMDANKDMVATVDEGGRQVSTLSAGRNSDQAQVENSFALNTVARELRSKLKDRMEFSASSSEGMKAMSVLNEVLIDMMEVDSHRKADAKRKGTVGYDGSFLRNFAKRADWSATTIPAFYSGPMFAEAFDTMRTEIGDLQRTDAKSGVLASEVADELKMRHLNAMRPVDSPIIDRVKALGHTFYLALSPAYLMINLMQPAHLTLPSLGSRFGFRTSAREIARATSVAFAIVKHAIKTGYAQGGVRGAVDAEVVLSVTHPRTGRPLMTAAEQAFMLRLIQSGEIDATMSHETARIAAGESPALATATKVVTLLNHYSEVVNRLTTGLATYRLMSAMKGGAYAGMTEDQKLDRAVKEIRDTQFNYSDHYGGRALGKHGVFGKMTPLFIQFQRYSFQMIEQYTRLIMDGFFGGEGVPKQQREEARKALYGTLFMTGTIAGTMGLPFASVIAAVANAAGDDDKDARAKYREWLEVVLGKDAAEIAAKGVFRLTGADIAGRAGHQDLIPFTRFLADRRAMQDKIKDGAVRMYGPATNAGLDLVAGVNAIMNGDFSGGLQKALPMALRHPVKAAELAAGGAYKDAAGRDIPLPVTSWDIGLQALGFSPATKAERSEANFYYQSEKAMTRERKAKLVKGAAKAFMEGDQEAYGEYMQEIAAYNEANPDGAITNSVSRAIVEGMRRETEGAASPIGIYERDARARSRLDTYNWANVE